MSRDHDYDVFNHTAIWDELLFCHRVFKFIYVELGKSPHLGDVDLLAAWELELGPVKGQSHMFFFCTLLWVDIMTWPTWTLATVPWGFLEALHILVWSLDWGQHTRHECPLEKAVCRVC